MATATETPQLLEDQVIPEGKLLDCQPEDFAPEDVQTRERDRRMANGLNIPIVSWLALLHIGALAAPFFISWEAVALTVFLHWLTGGIGICLGYHRLLTHSSFQTYRPIRWFLAMMGGLAGEGSSLDWVANHRKHHAHSDQPDDPHSPRDGAWWSHMLWLAWVRTGEEQEAFVKRWAPDLHRDKGLRIIGQLFLPSHFVMGCLLLGAGYAYGGTYMAASFLTWGLFMRLLFVLHTTWFVNSASHLWGYRNYETTDDSRNNWWVAILGYGEGWHNNHHAYPRMANHGHRWWEYDMTYRTIRLMARLGLAWKVIDYKQKTTDGVVK